MAKREECEERKTRGEERKKRFGEEGVGMEREIERVRKVKGERGRGWQQRVAREKGNGRRREEEKGRKRRRGDQKGNKRRVGEKGEEKGRQGERKRSKS